MTAPIQGFTITIQSDGTGLLSAPDFNTEGHTWALEGVHVDLETMARVVSVLGSAVESGYRMRLREELERAEIEARRVEEWISKAEAARARANTLRMVLEP